MTDDEQEMQHPVGNECPICKRMAVILKDTLDEVMTKVPPGSRATVILRRPENPAAFMVTNDDPEKALAAARVTVDEMIADLIGDGPSGKVH